MDYELAQFGAGWWWNGTNTRFFSSLQEINISYNIASLGTYHLALSWLVDGNYVLDNKKPNQDLDLYVYGVGGNQLASSTTARRNHEVVSFNANVVGFYRFRILRYRNNGGDNVIGLVLRKR